MYKVTSKLRPCFLINKKRGDEKVTTRDVSRNEAARQMDRMNEMDRTIGSDPRHEWVRMGVTRTACEIKRVVDEIEMHGL